MKISTTILQRVSLALALMSLMGIAALASGDNGIKDGCGYEKLFPVGSYSTSSRQVLPKSGCFPRPVNDCSLDQIYREHASFTEGYLKGRHDLDHGVYNREKEIPLDQSVGSIAHSYGYLQARLERPQDGNN